MCFQMSDWASWANVWHGTRWLRTAKWDSGDHKISQTEITKAGHRKGLSRCFTFPRELVTSPVCSVEWGWPREGGKKELEY